MYSVTKNGKPLDKKLYTIDEKTKTFSSNESGLVLDFSNEYGWAFDTGSNCTFNTGYGCVAARRDVYEVIELKEGKKIKLNGYNIKGYKVLVKKAKEVQEFTVAEISEKLGYDVKIIK